MPLEPPDQKILDAACGYVELGMYLDANEQLENVDPFNRAAPEILALRVAIYSGLKKWDLMLEISKRLVEFQPNDVQWTVSFAYATRRADSIEAARGILLNAESKFPKEAIIPYNLAFYECRLGNVESAKDYLKRVFESDRSWRLQALDDADLQPLWESL